MTTKTKATKQKSRKAPPRARSTAEVLKEKWEAAVRSLAAAEGEVEKQIRQFVSKSKMSRDAGRTFNELRAKLETERKKAARELEGRLGRLQDRLQQERKNMGQRVDGAVQRALVAFDIPSRREVGELTRKVDELSRKIDRFRTGRRAAAVRKAARRS